MNITTPFIDNSKSKEYNRYGGFHTGVTVDTKDVRTLSSGVVIHIGREFKSDSQNVIIKYNNSQAFNYAQLNEVAVQLGDDVIKNQYIGTSKKDVRIEYLDKLSESKQWPVRIGMETWYKVDPTNIVEGREVIDKSDEWYHNINVKASMENWGYDDPDAADNSRKWGGVT